MKVDIKDVCRVLEKEMEEKQANSSLLGGGGEGSKRAQFWKFHNVGAVQAATNLSSWLELKGLDDQSLHMQGAGGAPLAEVMAAAQAVEVRALLLLSSQTHLCPHALASFLAFATFSEISFHSNARNSSSGVNLAPDKLLCHVLTTPLVTSPSHLESYHPSVTAEQAVCKAKYTFRSSGERGVAIVQNPFPSYTAGFEGWQTSHAPRQICPSLFEKV
ncbi:hypothetical protein Anapl_02329 [Anas platyrhynchos]|uniref:Uncharacterized protein n=1 Tax=Anas platyrhynchos TaxID=8839 RepID=R0L6E1_ANAPL|nr:hypothetical protein Anapl_02329 [Anas platyrhynchos]